MPTRYCSLHMRGSAHTDRGVAEVGIGPRASSAVSSSRSQVCRPEHHVGFFTLTIVHVAPKLSNKRGQRVIDHGVSQPSCFVCQLVSGLAGGSKRKSAGALPGPAVHVNRIVRAIQHAAQREYLLGVEIGDGYGQVMLSGRALRPYGARFPDRSADRFRRLDAG